MLWSRGLANKVGETCRSWDTCDGRDGVRRQLSRLRLRVKAALLLSAICKTDHEW